MRLPWNPVPDEHGAWEPSTLSRWFAVPQKTGYRPREWPRKADPERHRVLVVCTEQGQLATRSGRPFATGNHPVETLVPILHLEAAGFGIDIATPTGAPAVIETWALPRKDEAVMEAWARHQPALRQPLDLRELAAELSAEGTASGQSGALARTVGLFFPGGHGALLGLPDDPQLGRLLRWNQASGHPTLSLCHGPAALLAAARDGGPFPFRGYEAVAFPDRVDRLTPWIGYLPGQPTWFFGEALAEQGVTLRNRGISGAVHRDRDLITGDSPDAADAFGVLGAQALLEAVAD